MPAQLAAHRKDAPTLYPRGTHRGGTRRRAAAVPAILPTGGGWVVNAKVSSLAVDGTALLKPNPSILELVGSSLCGSQAAGVLRHRRDIVLVTASARWRGDSMQSTRYYPRNSGGSMAWGFTSNLTHRLVSTQAARRPSPGSSAARRSSRRRSPPRARSRSSTHLSGLC